MRLITLGSSSAGNGYLLRASTGETLILEAGVKLAIVKQSMNFNLSDITGCLLSHSHKDHSGHVAEYHRAGIKCYMNQHTRDSNFKGYSSYNVFTLRAKHTYQISTFKVLPIELKHDVPNFGYLIDHPESGLFCFITDTHYCTYKFPGLNNVIIEANYSDEIVNKKLAEGTANLYVRNRVIKSHMELQTTLDFLRANDLSAVNNIVLIHLSDSNSDAALFQQQVQEATGKSVYVATPGMDIPFNKTAF